MYGLVDIQRSLDDSAMKGLAHAAEMQKQRDIANQQMKSAQRAQRANSVGTGAGTGAMIGMAAGGPIGAGVGAVVGGGVGYLTHKFFG